MVDQIADSIVNGNARNIANTCDFLRDLMTNGSRVVDQENGAAQAIQTLHFQLPEVSFNGTTPGAIRKITDNERADQERKKGDPVFRIGDCPRAQWRQEEIAETDRRRKRRKH